MANYFELFDDQPDSCVLGGSGPLIKFGRHGTDKSYGPYHLVVGYPGGVNAGRLMTADEIHQLIDGMLSVLAKDRSGD